MATIDYKEKYEQALERARQFSEKPYLEDSAGIVEYIFPELTESEDERVRKALLEMVHDTTGDELWVDYNVHKEDALAWLEKQGEITKEWSEMKTNNIQTELQEMVDLKQKTEQGEQKPQRMVSAEAKEAVLNEKQEEQVSEEFINALGTMLNDRLPDKYIVSEERIKKLAEFLFSIARKQLKNEMQEWSEDDETMIALLHNIISHQYSMDIIKKEEQLKLEDWLKSLKDRVQPKPRQEWSEEDDTARNALINLVEMYYGGCIDKSEKNRLLNFLKSLRPQNRWKPSDLPHWKKSTLPNDNTTGFNSDYFCYKGYNINYKELFEKLPKDD